MVNVEKIIREDIDAITVEHFVIIKQDIKRDIKYAYWQGLIDDTVYCSLNIYLEEKASKILDDYFEKSYKSYIQHLDAIINSKNVNSTIPNAQV